MDEFEWYQGYLLKWTERNLKKIEKWQKNNCERAAFLEMLEIAIIFQRFPCMRKLSLQEYSEIFRHIKKYAFFV